MERQPQAGVVYQKESSPRTTIRTPIRSRRGRGQVDAITEIVILAWVIVIFARMRSFVRARSFPIFCGLMGTYEIARK